MAAFIRELKTMYDAALEAGDPRVLDWPLMSSPLPVFAIIAVYNIFVKFVGPKLMENRPPMDLKNVMIVYNSVVTLTNFWFVEESLRNIWLVGRYHLYKEPIDYSDDPFALYVASMVWWFFVSKIVDMFDTVFIVLRKKKNQLSFLHTYHHSIMVFVIWLSAKYIAGGSVTIVGTVNATVHTVMYTYYLLTLINPEYKKSVWWKRHLTELQLAQFVFLSIVGMLIVIYSENTLLRICCAFGFTQDMFFLILFSDFYNRTYLSKKKDTVKDN